MARSRLSLRSVGTCRLPGRTWLGGLGHLCLGVLSKGIRDKPAPAATEGWQSAERWAHTHCIVTSWNPGLWLWVLMSCLPEVHPCLLCFAPPLQRARLCRDITGAFIDHPRHTQCLVALVEAAKPLASITVGLGQREGLREIVMDALYSIEEKKAEFPACIPPCGFQPAARFFRCATCSLGDCQFGLDCPVQDLWTYTDETIVLRCTVPFPVPAGLPVTWMFAPNLRTQDMTLFKKLKGDPEKPFSLTIEEPAPGTVACRLGESSKPIVRMFFYLNGPSGSSSVSVRNAAEVDTRVPKSLPDPWIHCRGL
ncbi:sperm acrosome membrane-associated protein 6 [Hirundo rustica]|uniref:sperm acrosome membrane-associated protein 6 n=1 Tax=Hirundo rustica TaxID=43150 RepID=UPI002671C3C9|nr:sperm acrosome membrane-associated protein 6 [Hirundo rustica]